MIAILEYEIREICREASIPVSSGLDRLDADLEAHGEFALTLSAPVRDTLRELLRVRREILVRGDPAAVQGNEGDDPSTDAISMPTADPDVGPAVG